MVDINKKGGRLSYWIALSVILILGVFAIIVYKERMLFVDPAWITFNIINSHSFVIAEHRYGSFITQIYPLLGVYFELSLKTILILYSAAFYIFYLGSTLIVGLLWKQRWLGILLALYLTLFVSDGYYWPSNEVHQGITWMVLFLGFYGYLQEKQSKSIVSYLLLTAFAFLALSSHLLVTVPLVFLWIYIHSEKKIKLLVRDKRFVFMTLLLAGLIFFRYKLSSEGWYDAGKLQATKNLSLNKIKMAFQSGQSHSFIRLLFSNYWSAIVLFLISFGLLFKTKRIFKLGLLIAFIIGYYILVCLTFPDSFDRNWRFYMESEWAALSLLIATPFVIALVESPKRLSPLLFVLVAIFCIRLGYIFHSYSFFHKRLENLEMTLQTLHHKNISKALVLEDSKQAKKQFIMGWGLSAESMLLSKLQQNSVQTTFKIDSTFKHQTIGRDSFYSAFSIEPTGKLNRRYFVLDSTQDYQVLEGSEIEAKK